MTITLGAKPDHDFNEPLGLLGDCHRRIEHFLAVLLRVAAEAYRGDLRPQQAQALEASLCYFRSAAPRHTDDEEISLFARMRASPDPRAREAMNSLGVLEADHRVASAIQDEIDVLGSRWLQQGSISRGDAVRIGQLLRELRDLYKRHIKVEDNEVFPLASRVLAAEEITQIGCEMARRRGVNQTAARSQGKIQP